MTEKGRVTTLPRREFKRQSSGEHAAAYIRSLIFHGELRRGDRIRQDQLAEALGLSRIPVREAIIALDREGWVTSEPHKGAYVNGFDRAGVADHYEMLGLLYGLASTRATERGSDDDLTKIVALQKSQRAATDPDDLYRVNEQLIRTMFSAADSPRLSAVTRVLTPVVPGNFFEAVPGAIADQKRGVARAVKAMAARDGAKAAGEWQRLLHLQGEHVISLLDKTGLFSP